MNIDDLISDIRKGPSRWELVREALDDFQSYLSSRIPKLNVEEGCITEVTKRVDRLDGCGVYLLYDLHDRLLYIGLTGDDFTKRVNCHRRRFEPQYIDLVILPKKLSWLAYSLERFLIKDLRPLFNEVGI